MKKDKSVSRLIRVFSLAVLFGTTLWAMNRTGILSLIGTEDVYWERARFLLGQGGASLYEGSSLCSLGYSLILLPICALFKSPYAAYKAAVLLNGFFLCVAYLFAAGAAKKLFPNERESVLCAACFFAVFCPALMTSRSYTGPETAVLLLTWISIYLLSSLWEKADTRDLVLLTLCMILIGFLEISALGLILGIVILLAFYVKEKKLTENAFLSFVLALLLGLAAGNIAERIVLTSFAEDLGIAGSAVLSSLEVFLSGIGSFMESGFLVKFCSTFMGKLYSVLIASFLLICPALWRFIRKIIKKDAASEENSDSSNPALPACTVTGLFLIQFLFMCFYDVSLGLEEGMLSLSGLEMILPAVILIGMMDLKKAKNWETQLPAYLLLLCICTFSAAASLNGIGAAGGSGVNNGFLSVFFGLDQTTDATTIYLAACAVMFVSLILACLFLVKFKNRTLNNFLKGAGTFGAFGLVLVISFMSLNEVSAATGDVSMERIAPLASLLGEMEDHDDLVYIADGGDKEGIAILQFLLPDKEIKIISVEDAPFYNEDEAVILTRAVKDKVQGTYVKDLDNYQNIYMTRSYAIWVPKESGCRSELEEKTIGQPVNLTLTKDEETEEELLNEEDGGDEEAPSTLLVRTLTYEGSLPLSAGSYRAEFYLHFNSEPYGEGKLTVSDDSGTVSEKSFSEVSIDESGNAVVFIDFTDYDSMWSVKLTLSGSLFTSAEVTEVYYWKMDSAYTVGLNDESDLNKAAKFIRKLDKSSGEPGTVAYLDDFTFDSDHVSLEVLKSCLPDHEISTVTLNGLLNTDADYLIAGTDAHSYYSVMDHYAIIDRESGYTVLARVDSVPYRTYLEQNGRVLSEGTKIDIRAFLKKASKPVTSPVSLEMGDYLYDVRLTYDAENLQGADEDTAGILYLKNNEEILAERDVTYSELRNGGGDLVISVPLSLPEQKKKLTCQLELNGTEEIVSEPAAIELVSEHYQYGKEEPELPELLSEVNAMEEPATVSVVQTEANIREKLIDYSWLSDQIPLCEVEEISSSAALKKKNDGILITYGLSSSNLQLLDQYSILEHAGKYTLWAKNDGSYIQKMTEAGAAVLNSGTKISPMSLAYMYGTEPAEGVIAYLNGASYNVYVKLQAEDLDPDDTVTVALYRDKGDSSIRTELQDLADGGTLSEKEQTEVEDLLENGYTMEEAGEYIDTKVSCGSKSVAASEFEEDGTAIVSVTKSESSAAGNLSCEAYTWHNGEAKGEILWVELR